MDIGQRVVDRAVVNEWSNNKKSGEPVYGFPDFFLVPLVSLVSLFPSILRSG
jgi:hypothetical protein